MKYYLFTVLYLVVLLQISACNGKKQQDVGSKNNPYQVLFKDTCYLAGFNVSDVIDGKPGILRVLDYDGKSVGTPFWSIAQWNNYQNNLKDAPYSSDGDIHSYMTANGTGVIVDTQTGKVTLQINTSSEYGKSEVCPNNPRKTGDKWPHLLMAYDLSEDEILKIADKQEIWMNMDYTLTQSDNNTPAKGFDINIHGAEYQWYITVQNRTKDSSGYGEYLWFGLAYYDTRHDYPPFYAAEDFNTTNSFIYKPSIKELMAEQGKTEVGKRMKVNANILPLLKEAFALAQERGYLKTSSWQDLYISSMNVGWEVFGTYDLSVTIDACQINYR